MKVKFLIVLTFLLASIFFLVINAEAKRLKQITERYEAKIEGYGIDDYKFGKTNCVDFTKEKRVCKGYKSDDGVMYFIIQKNQETIITWQHPIGTGSYTEDFHVYYGDLDKNNLPELVVVSNVNTSNGLGVTQANIYISSEPLGKDLRKPLVFPIEEFGERGNFIFDSKRNETQILVTYWSSFDNLDKKRGYGTYLVGKWFRYRNGLLEPIFGKPT